MHAVDALLECIRLQRLESLVISLIPGIYDLLNQEEGSARFFPI